MQQRRSFPRPLHQRSQYRIVLFCRNSRRTTKRYRSDGRMAGFPNCKLISTARCEGLILTAASLQSQSILVRPLSMRKMFPCCYETAAEAAFRCEFRSRSVSKCPEPQASTLLDPFRHSSRKHAAFAKWSNNNLYASPYPHRN